MTNIEKTLLIDRYLAGEMTEEEKKSFEWLLSEGDLSSMNKQSLREEMELQKEIELAIQERGLREMLQREEKTIRRRQHFRLITFWSLGSGAVIAAVMLLLLIVAPLARQMQDFSTQYVAQVEVGVMRGDNDIADALNNALLLMQKGEWDGAHKIVDDVMAQIASSNDEKMRDIYDNAEWLKAICLMHSGKVFRAKSLLRKIADGESPYSAQAADLLEQF